MVNSTLNDLLCSESKREKLGQLLDLLRNKGVLIAKLGDFEFQFAPVSGFSPDNATDAEREAWRQRLESEEGFDAGEVRLPKGPLSAPGLFPSGVPLVPDYEHPEPEDD